jgi:hypothetical protein
MTKDGATLVPTPNYDQPIAELLKDLTRQFIVAHKSLDFIFAAESNTMTKSNLPSWAPNWLGPWTPSAVKLLARGLEPHRNLHLCDGESPGNVLTVKGIRIATVDSWAYSIFGHSDYSPSFYGSDFNAENALCEALFCDSFLSLKSKSKGIHKSEVASEKVEFEQSASKWFKSARQFLRILQHLGTADLSSGKLFTQCTSRNISSAHRKEKPRG